ASIHAGRIYQGSAGREILLVLRFAQNEVEIWKRWELRDQKRGLNQLGKIDILRFWQLRCTRAHHYHLPGAERASLARMMFERDSGVAFEDNEFDPRFGTILSHRCETTACHCREFSVDSRATGILRCVQQHAA